MKKSTALLGGLAGASALTLLHETARKYDKDAPQLQKLGMEAVEKTLESVDAPIPSKKNLFLIALAGEILSNTLYFSKVRDSGDKNVLMRGVMLGVVAGLTAVFLPKETDMNENASGKNDKRKAMTMGWYILGGLVAGGAALLLEKNKKPKFKLGL